MDRRGRLQAWLEARWYGRAPIPGPLRLLSRLYACLIERRRRRLQRRAQPLPVPVVVVGNISLGGAGKTPVVMALVETLRAAGWTPGVVSRGHGGRERGPALLPAEAAPERYGDEPALIALRTGVPVAVGRDRPATARHLLARHPQVDVLVCDDGLQHYRLHRDVEVVVVDGRRRFGNALLLPAGPLREPVSRLQEADVVLVNGPREGESGFTLAPGEALALDGSGARPLASFARHKVHAVAGIGDPARFFATLEAAGIIVVPHAFADHHDFRPADLAFRDGLPVLMTEKDAVKCRRFAQPGWYAVPVTARLPADAIATILRRIDSTRQARASAAH